MIHYVEAPKVVTEEALGLPKLFLAGGITGCPDWQATALIQFAARCAKNITVFNPRRKNFDVRDPTVAAQQIAWEAKWLAASDVIMFWFCEETLQPITLYELGAWTSAAQLLPGFAPRIAVGAHPAYPRRFDVLEQTRLKLPHVIVHDTLSATVTTAIDLLLGES